MGRFIKLIMLTISITVTYTYCLCQENNLFINDSTEEKANLLRSLYLKSFDLYPDSSEYYRQKFFENFPATFIEFKSLYGYQLIKDEFIPYDLYNEGYDHIKLFNELQDIIAPNIYFTKIIDVSLAGYWQSDGVAYLHKLLIDKFKINLCCFLTILKSYSDNEIYSFWYFYFDGPHPVEEIPDHLQTIKDFDGRVYSLMCNALEEVKESWKDSHE
jgi:hypothetical protein